jgi:hypothetical protein
MEMLINNRIEGFKAIDFKEMVENVNKGEQEADYEIVSVSENESIEFFDILSGATHYYRNPETDTLEKFKQRILYDKEVTNFIDMDKMAEFLYNCIDTNAISIVNNVIFTFDPYDKDDEAFITTESEIRAKVADIEYDEYAKFIGEDEEEHSQLGILWYEKSDIFINVHQLLLSAKDIVADESPAEIFRMALISTICHEFRHLLSDKCLFNEDYPNMSEDEVEAYGHNEMLYMIHNEKYSDYINLTDTPKVSHYMYKFDEHEEDLEL